jgi:predicted phosphodiesterase
VNVLKNGLEDQQANKDNDKIDHHLVVAGGDVFVKYDLRQVDSVGRKKPKTKGECDNEVKPSAVRRDKLKNALQDLEVDYTPAANRFFFHLACAAT